MPCLLEQLRTPILPHLRTDMLRAIFLSVICNRQARWTSKNNEYMNATLKVGQVRNNSQFNYLCGDAF